MITNEQKIELYDNVKNRKVKAIKLHNSFDDSTETLRLFISTCGTLCYYKGKSNRRGYPLTLNDHCTILKVFLKPTKEEREKLIEVSIYKTIEKYRIKAEKAGFTNRFITACLALPKSYEQWVEEGKKGTYEYHLTTGNSIDGEIITVSRIEKTIGFEDVHNLINEFLKNNTKTFQTNRYKFGSYEGTVSGHIASNGQPMITFSKEYANCGNGYYYLLINENEFIGYDVD